MYSIERYESTISVEEYLRDYVDVETFLETCKECRNYNKTWTCPSYDFKPEEYWGRYKNFHLIGEKVIFNKETTEKTYTPDEIRNILNKTLFIEKLKLTEELWKMEAETPGSVSLSPGNCAICGEGNCTRPQGQPCIYPDKLRYSMESIGGNVGKTCSKLMGVELEWVTEGKLPNYFMLVCGLLTK